MLHVPHVQGNDAVAEPISADIGTDLTARNLGDMRAFINLADFVGALLPACGPTMFRGWAYLMTLELVAASGQRPLLSGFYRMLTVTMRLTSAAGILQMTGQHERHRVCLCCQTTGMNELSAHQRHQKVCASESMTLLCSGRWSGGGIV